MTLISFTDLKALQEQFQTLAAFGDSTGHAGISIIARDAEAICANAARPLTGHDLAFLQAAVNAITKCA